MPTYQLKAEVPERGQPRDGQRGAHRRRARRRGQHDHAERRQDGTSVAVARPEARQGRRARCRATRRVHRAPALGARPQVRRDHARARPSAASPTAPRSRSRRRDAAPVELDEFLEHVRRARRAPRSQANLRGLRRRVRRARRVDSTPRSARFRAAAARTSSRWRSNLAAPRHAARALLPRARATAARGGAGGRDAGGAVRATSTRRSARWRRWRRPFIQDTITEGPPTLDAAIARRSRSSARSSPTPTALFARAAARRAARCAPRRRRSPTRSSAGTPALRARRRRSTSGSSSLLRSLQTFADDPLVPRGVERLTETVAGAAADAAYLAPAQTTCNYVTLLFRNVATLLSEGDATAPGSASSSSRRRRARTTRAARRRRPPNGPTARQPPAHEPVPEHGGAGPAEGVRGGQRAVRCVGKTVIGNVAGQRRAATERRPVRDALRPPATRPRRRPFASG